MAWYQTFQQSRMAHCIILGVIFVCLLFGLIYLYKWNDWFIGMSLICCAVGYNLSGIATNFCATFLILATLKMEDPMFVGLSSYQFNIYCQPGPSRQNISAQSTENPTDSVSPDPPTLSETSQVTPRTIVHRTMFGRPGDPPLDYDVLPISEY